MTALALVPLVFVIGCGRSPEAQSAVPALPAAVSAPQPSSSLPDLSPGLEMPPRLSRDVLWQAAARGDSLDLHRLAQREGPAGLLEAVELGGQAALVALRALPFAERSEDALGRLCELLVRLPAEQLEPLLEATREILARTFEQHERAGGWVLSCRLVLTGLAQDSRLGASTRDLAASSAALLENTYHGSP